MVSYASIRYICFSFFPVAMRMFLWIVYNWANLLWHYWPSQWSTGSLWLHRSCDWWVQNRCFVWIFPFCGVWPGFPFCQEPQFFDFRAQESYGGVNPYSSAHIVLPTAFVIWPAGRNPAFSWGFLSYDGVFPSFLFSFCRYPWCTRLNLPFF